MCMVCMVMHMHNMYMYMHNNMPCTGERLLLVWERGAWSTPGGAVNAGENKLEALEREVYEELQAEVSQ